MPNLKNWSGNYEYSTANVFYPQTVEQVQTIVRQQPTLRALGTRHCFNSIADSTVALISLERFAPSVQIDAERRTATISPNFRYGDLCQTLHDAGFALHNLASLGHINVIGGFMTATHGSGVRNRNLASAVSALDIVTANGDLVHLSRDQDGDRFNGVVVALGALGVVVSVTLDLVPAFEVSQHVYQHVPYDAVYEHFDAITSSAYSVSLFTDWQHDTLDQVWIKQRVGDPLTTTPDAYGAVPATGQMHPIAGISGDQCTAQMGVPGAWYDRLPHFRIDAKPSAGDELQTEYFVARADAVEAMRAISTLRDVFAPHIMVNEIRCIAADDLWLSPCYHQDSVAFHFTWKLDWESVQKVLPQLEAKLAPFNPKPHWGKLFTLTPQVVQSRYPRLPDFKTLMQQLDPAGKFRNDFVDTTLFSA